MAPDFRICGSCEMGFLCRRQIFAVIQVILFINQGLAMSVWMPQFLSGVTTKKKKKKKTTTTTTTTLCDDDDDDDDDNNNNTDRLCEITISDPEPPKILISPGSQS
ncbi:hypothetical protein RUM44_006650 [Polyplax serrata]|uniref:Uncharacterized protein n=1 Tax=Polyplax serrata TaxID=468196 RepID=A0ABR1AIM6_POLSC